MDEFRAVVLNDRVGSRSREEDSQLEQTNQLHINDIKYDAKTISTMSDNIRSQLFQNCQV